MGETAQKLNQELPKRHRMEIVEEGFERLPRRTLPKAPIQKARRTPVSRKAKKPQVKPYLFTLWQKGVLAAMILAFVGLRLATLISYNQVSTMQQDMKKSQQEVIALQAESDLLTMKLAPYQDPERMMKLATDRLGMRIPKEDRIVTLSSQDHEVYKNLGEGAQLARDR